MLSTQALCPFSPNPRRALLCHSALIFLSLLLSFLFLFLFFFSFWIYTTDLRQLLLLLLEIALSFLLLWHRWFCVLCVLLSCVLCFCFCFSWGIWKLLFCFTCVLISFLLLLLQPIQLSSVCCVVCQVFILFFWM